jgi:transcriptional regulator with XRE-family HTH domain
MTTATRQAGTHVDTPTSDTAAKTVAKLRVELGVTLQELATRTGISARVLSLIDRKHYRASPDQVQRIAEALGVAAEALDIGLPEAQPGTWGTGGTYS